MKKRLISFFLALALMACPVHALEGESLRAANDLSALGLVQGTPGEPEALLPTGTF